MTDNKTHTDKKTETKKYKSKGKEYIKPTPEQKSFKFKKLAMARGNRAIKYIELLGNLSSKCYVYNDEQVMAIFAGIREAVNDTEKLFTAKTKVEKVRIQL